MKIQSDSGLLCASPTANNEMLMTKNDTHNNIKKKEAVEEKNETGLSSTDVSPRRTIEEQSPETDSDRMTDTSSPIRRRRRSTINQGNQHTDTVASTKLKQKPTKHNVFKEMFFSFLSILGAILVIYVCLYL